MTLMYESLLDGGQTEVTTPLKSVRLQIVIFIYSRTAVFISTFYSRKSELFLKKGGVILSGLATDIIVLYPALELNQFLPLAASRATADSVYCSS